MTRVSDKSPYGGAVEVARRNHDAVFSGGYIGKYGR